MIQRFESARRLKQKTDSRSEMGGCFIYQMVWG
jgi:hypothetical protein